VYDDIFNDGILATSNTISIGSTAIYKYIGYPYGASSSVFSQLSQGTNEGDIRGNEITVLSLTIRGQFIVGDSSNIVRMIVFWDTDFGYVAPSGTQTLNFPGTNTHVLSNYNGANANATVPSVFTAYHLGMVGKGLRFKPLFDKTYTLSSEGDIAKFFHKKIKLRRKMGFLNSSPSTCTPNQGIGVMFISDSTVAPNPICYFSARLSYHS